MPPEVFAYGRDELLLERCRLSGNPEIDLHLPESLEVVLGRGSRIELELDFDACRADDVCVSRRLGGGCAVVLDEGGLVLSAALPLPGVGGVRAVFDGLTDWVIDGLARAGIPGVEKAGSSDLALDGRKVGGSCVYRTKGILLYSTTLLFRPPVAAAERYLAHPPREPDYRGGRAHGDFMGSLDPEGDIDPWLNHLRGILTPESLPEF